MNVYFLPGTNYYALPPESKAVKASVSIKLLIAWKEVLDWRAQTSVKGHLSQRFRRPQRKLPGGCRHVGIVDSRS
jgi:hypothetical protein